MSMKQTLTSVAAALTVAGTIGFAYAQTTDTAPVNGASNQTMQNPREVPAQPAGSTATTPPATDSTTTTTPSTTTDSTMPAERAAQADRN